ncbi:MAG: hypothetical protein Q9M33_05320 [Robiginitomaculum sp.]|nr:hypothetical protein [Robiginitomaculum sp.]MDQ7078547.1 hypothetical protein [Robiginitomaculum sp.]
MTLEQAYLIAQILASIAVVVSLIFVGLQLRHNSEQMRIAASTGYYEIYRDHMVGVNSKEFTNLFIKGFEGIDALDLCERTQLYAFFAVMTRGYQILHYQFRKKVFDKELWENTQNHLADFLLSKAYQEFWLTRRHHFNPSFQAFVDDLIANRPAHSLFSETAPQAEVSAL